MTFDLSFDSHCHSFSDNLIEQRVVDRGLLNYMLIHAAITDALQKGLLREAQAHAPWVGTPRTFLMCAELWSAIEEGRQSQDIASIKRWASLEADISHFIEGGYVNEDLLKQLEDFKHEHWELRSVRPKPSLRVFGRFALPNVFVGTHVVERRLLAEKHSFNWEHQRIVCEDHWTAAGLPDPFTDDPDFAYSSYITNNATRRIEVPI